MESAAVHGSGLSELLHPLAPAGQVLSPPLQLAVA